VTLELARRDEGGAREGGCDDEEHGRTVPPAARAALDLREH
jgi:hypothetical protein